MNALQFLFPDNPAAALIVGILMILVLLWYGVLLIWSIGLNRRQKEMRQCCNVESLRDGLKTLTALSVTSTGPALVAIETKAQTIFSDYCDEVKVRADGIIAQHIKAIFDAGWKGSRLDIAELNKHTTARLYRALALLRSLLAIFIIVGLLGTLIGLSSSLAQLSPLNLGGSVQSATELSQGLNHLLGELKSAFAPSIWGVLLTLICVLVLSSYLHFKAAPISNSIKHLTLTVWVPQLFPATSRRFLETVQLSEQHMQKSFEIARELAGFTSDIRTEVSNFREHLITANRPLELLSQSAAQLVSFVGTFSESTGKISSFQVELKTLYDQMVNESKVFHTSVKDNIMKSADFDEEMQIAMKSQGEQIKSLMLTMNSYERAYIESRSQLDLKLMELLSEAKKAYSATLTQNQTIANDIGGPLRTTLITSLGELQNTMRQELHKEHEQLEGVVSSVRELMSSVNEGTQRNLESMKKIADSFTTAVSQQAEAQEAGFKLQKDAASATQGLIKNVETLSRTQTEQLTNLRHSVDNLTGTLKSLDGNLKWQPTTIYNSAPHDGKTSKQTEDGQTVSDSVAAISPEIIDSSVKRPVGEDKSDHPSDPSKGTEDSKTTGTGSRLLDFFSKYK
jgi:MotA/TolQ/ExbB proton channel family